MLRSVTVTREVAAAIVATKRGTKAGRIPGVGDVEVGDRSPALTGGGFLSPPILFGLFVRCGHFLDKLNPAALRRDEQAFYDL